MFEFVFPLPVMLPLRLQNSSQSCLREGFLLCGNFSFTTPSAGQASNNKSFVSLSVFYILSYLLSKRMGCLSGCLVTSASIQSCFVKLAHHSNDLLMNLWGRKCTPGLIPPPSWDHSQELLEVDFKCHPRHSIFFLYKKTAVYKVL